MFTFAAEGRRLARRAIIWQAAAVAVAALAFLAKGADWALAVALGGGVNPSTVALARLMAGVAVKWVVVVGVLLLGIALAGLPPLPMLVGVVVALVAQLLAMAGPAPRP